MFSLLVGTDERKRQIAEQLLRLELRLAKKQQEKSKS